VYPTQVVKRYSYNIVKGCIVFVRQNVTGGRKRFRPYKVCLAMSDRLSVHTRKLWDLGNYKS